MKKCQIQVVWCGERDGDTIYDIYPPREETEIRFLFTNDIVRIGEIFSGSSLSSWFLIDGAELKRLIFPELTDSVANDVADAPDVKVLWREWQQCSARLDVLPFWAHELCSSLFTSIDERGLSALFNYWGQNCISDNAERNWKNSFAPTVKRVEKRTLPDLSDCSQLDPNEVASFLESGGALSKLVSGYEPRLGQIKMVKAVTEAFNSGSHLIAEAGTGIGKSLAYLLPAALWAQLNDVPVVISTNTKNLQSQLVEKDLPAVLKMLEKEPKFQFAKPLSAAVIKGRSNYICLRRFANLQDGGLFELQLPEVKMLISTIVWLLYTQDGDFDALTGSGAVDPQFINLLSCGSEECSGRSCPFYTRCFIQKARERSLRANLVIANHSLVLAELAADQPISIPAHAQLVFDEAHNLEDAATNFFSKRLSSHEVTSLTSRIVQSRGKKSRGIIPQLKKHLLSGAISPRDKEGFYEKLDEIVLLVKKLNNTSDDLFKAMHGLLQKGEQPRRFAFEATPSDMPLPAPDAKWKLVREKQALFVDRLMSLKRALETVISRLEEPEDDRLNLAMGDTNDLGATVTKVDELLSAADVILSGVDENYVFWIQKSFSYGAVGEACAAPLNVGEFLSKRLYEFRSTIVFCSATLSVGGSYKYIASRLGLNLISPERLAIVTAQSPFDYASQSSLLVPTYLPEPMAEDRSYVGELSNLVLEVAAKYDGRTLVLFTSYEMMTQSAALVKDGLEKMGIELLIQGKSGSRNCITRVFRRQSKKVLFGTQSFWEGVDVVGDALSCVIVARLPFTSPSDPVISARCEQIDAQGGRSFIDLMVPIAVLKLRQGFGRLIRHRLDKGSVIIADTRIINKGYGLTFRKSLPVNAKTCLTQGEVIAQLVLQEPAAQ